MTAIQLRTELFREMSPLNELFDKPIINQNPENDRQLSLW